MLVSKLFLYLFISRERKKNPLNKNEYPRDIVVNQTCAFTNGFIRFCLKYLTTTTPFSVTSRIKYEIFQTINYIFSQIITTRTYTKNSNRWYSYFFVASNLLLNEMRKKQQFLYDIYYSSSPLSCYNKHCCGEKAFLIFLPHNFNKMKKKKEKTRQRNRKIRIYHFYY